MDQERRGDVVQELKQGLYYELAERFLERGGGRRRDDVDEREGGGDGDLIDPEMTEFQVYIPDCG